MNKEEITRKIYDQYKDLPGNYISEEDAISKDLVGMKIFEEPLVGFGSAKDELFEDYKKKEIIGPWHMAPTDWMPEAKTVVSIFFPFTDRVKDANAKAKKYPAPEWLHGRIEGQDYLVSFIKALKTYFEKEGLVTCVPSFDERFFLVENPASLNTNDLIDKETYGCNWSERHAAYACGLGTFSLSRSFISSKGSAGRLASIIIDAQLPPDKRAYSGVYDNCNMCGACARRCPVSAIDLEKGKDNLICGRWVAHTKEIFAPRYGCGFCQTGVPCQNGIPKKRKA